MKTSAIIISAILIFGFSACSEKDKEARVYLDNIKSLYEKGEYDNAKEKIDSIQVLFPKAFDERKEALALLQDVRRAQNLKQIAFCDSVINVLEPKIDSLKKSFKYDIDKKYQEKGRFLPKAIPTAVLGGTTLRSGVNENGQLFIESVYVGSNQYHESVKVSMKDGSFAETFVVNEDGLNFRFTDAGKHYEVITFAGKDENGIGKFIYAFSDKPVTATLQGKNTYSFVLSTTVKKSIADSYLLSQWMQNVDSLKLEKDKAKLLIEYVNKKKNDMPVDPLSE